MHKAGDSIAADDLLHLCDLAEVGQRLWPANVLAKDRTWEDVKKDFLEMQSSEKYYPLIGFDIKLAVTKKVVMENAKSKQWRTWALRVWPSPHAAGQRSSDSGPFWTIQNARMSALLQDLLQADSEPEKEVLEELEVAIMDQLCGDYVYNSIVSADTQRKVDEGFQEYVKVIADLIHGAPLEEQASEALPKIADAKRLLLGLQGLISPLPSAFSHARDEDVEFVLPFKQGKGFGAVASSSLRSGQAIGRTLKHSEFWKTVQGEYQRFAGTATTTGYEIKEVCDNIDKLTKMVDTDVKDEEIEKLSQQAAAVNDLQTTLQTAIDNRTSFEDSIRPGGIQPLLDSLAKGLKSMDKYCKACVEVPSSRYSCLRDLAEALGSTDMKQRFSDELLKKVETNAAAKLDTAIQEIGSPPFGPARMAALHAALVNTSNIQMAADQISALHAVAICIVKTMAGTSGCQDENVMDLRGTLKPHNDVLSLLVKIQGLTDLEMGGRMSEDHKIFVDLVEKILDMRKHFKITLAAASDEATLRQTFDKLASVVKTLIGKINKPPQWRGIFLEEGETLLRYAETYKDTTLASLDTQGAQYISASANLLNGRIAKLDQIAGGTTDGSWWLQGVAVNAADVKIIEAFDQHLKSFDGDDAKSKCDAVEEVR